MRKNANTQTPATINNETAIFGGITFNRDSMLEQYASTSQAEDGTDIVTYAMPLEVIDAKLETTEIVVTDATAIEAICGLRNADKLEKWSSYRKGAYLVQLVDSPFMVQNDIKSVEKLAKMVNLGVEGSSANSLESVARKLGVHFDDSGNLHFADENLPMLSFWHYNNVISLVTQNDDGSYNYDVLKDFLAVANVTPLMSQKRIKEQFNAYRNGTLNNSVALPDKVREKAEKDAKSADDRKRKAEQAKATVTAKTALENAQSFIEKQAVAITAIQALSDCFESLGIEYDFSELSELVNSAEAPTATPTEIGEAVAEQ